MARLGTLRIDRIGREDVLQVLTPIWTSKPETARRIRRCIKQVLGWAQANGYIEQNVAGEMISAALPAMPSVKQNMRSLSYKDISSALHIIRNSRASLSAKSCLEFVMLTACRSGEARLAHWAEIDMDNSYGPFPASV